MLCNKCHIDKSIDKFRARKLRGKLVIVHTCLDCERSYARVNANKYYANNKEKCLANANRYYIDNREAKLEYEKGPERKRYRAMYKKHRYTTDPIFRFKFQAANRIRNAIKLSGIRTKKSAHTRELLGCSFEDLKLHLERQFRDGMSWDSYGWGNNKWNIDHIIPIDVFDLSDPIEQKQCFHYTNLQPLWQPDNFRKHNKVNTI